MYHVLTIQICPLDNITSHDAGYSLDDTGYKKLQVTPHKSAYIMAIHDLCARIDLAVLGMLKANPYVLVHSRACMCLMT